MNEQQTRLNHAFNDSEGQEVNLIIIYFSSYKNSGCLMLIND